MTTNANHPTLRQKTERHWKTQVRSDSSNHETTTSHLLYWYRAQLTHVQKLDSTLYLLDSERQK